MSLEQILAITLGILAVFGAFSVVYASYKRNQSEIEKEELRSKIRQSYYDDLAISRPPVMVDPWSASGSSVRYSEYIPVSGTSVELNPWMEVRNDKLQEEGRKADERVMEASRNGFKKVVTRCKYCGRITKNEHEFCVGCGAPV